MMIHFIVFWIGALLPSTLPAPTDPTRDTTEPGEGVNYFRKVQMNIWADLESGNVTAKFKDCSENRSPVEIGGSESGTWMKGLDKEIPEDVESNTNMLGSTKNVGDFKAINIDFRKIQVDPFSNSLSKNENNTEYNTSNGENAIPCKLTSNDTSLGSKKSIMSLNLTTEETFQDRMSNHRHKVLSATSIATMSPYVSELLLNMNESPLNISEFTLSPALLKGVQNDRKASLEKPAKSSKGKKPNQTSAKPKPTEDVLSPTPSDKPMPELDKCPVSSTSKKPESKFRLPFLHGSTSAHPGSGSDAAAASVAAPTKAPLLARLGGATTVKADRRQQEHQTRRSPQLHPPQVERDYLSESTHGTPTKRSTFAFPDDDASESATDSAASQPLTLFGGDSWAVEGSSDISIESTENVATTNFEPDST